MGHTQSLEEITDILEVIRVNDNTFDFGITSVDLFLLKKLLDVGRTTSSAVPLGVLLMTPTIRASQMASLETDEKSEGKNDLLVPLQSSASSDKIPLWSIHPGSGNVLVFIALAKHFPNRRVYGLQRMGLNTSLDNKKYLTSIADIADCYVSHIFKHQPVGPYALAGYSLGSTVGFEVAKRLEKEGQEVAFLGLLDSPPYMRQLIEHLDWAAVLLNVAYFFESISEGQVNGVDFERSAV